MDAQRAANVLGIPFYVWDFSERFKADVVDDFIAEYSAGRTPNPCMRCNERIKFAALLEKALALGFDAVCTGHYATIVTDAARQPRAAPRERMGEGPVLRARRAHRRAARARVCSRSATTPSKAARARRGRRARPDRRAEARLARHLLHPRRRHPRLARRARRRGDGRRSSTARAPSSARTRARTPSPSASAGACTSAFPRPTASRGSCSRCARRTNTVVVGPEGGARDRRDRRLALHLGRARRPRIPRRRSTATCRSARTPTPCRRWRVVADGELVDHPGASARRRRPRPDRRHLRRHPRARPVHDRPHRQRGARDGLTRVRALPIGGGPVKASSRRVVLP